MKIDIFKRTWIKERILNLGEVDGEYMLKHGERFNDRLQIAWYTNLERYIFLRFYPVENEVPKDEDDFFSDEEYWIIEELNVGIHKDTDYRRLSEVVSEEDMNRLPPVFENVVNQCMFYSTLGKNIVSDIKGGRLSSLEMEDIVEDISVCVPENDNEGATR